MCVCVYIHIHMHTLMYSCYRERYSHAGAKSEVALCCQIREHDLNHSAVHHTSLDSVSVIDAGTMHVEEMDKGLTA